MILRNPMPNCPICQTASTSKYLDTPYWICPSCDCWWQFPMPSKTYEADHEKTSDGGFAGHLMSDHEKGVNRWLASSILDRWFHNKPIKVLDIKEPYQGCNILAPAVVNATLSKSCTSLSAPVTVSRSEFLITRSPFFILKSNDISTPTPIMQKY